MTSVPLEMESGSDLVSARILMATDADGGRTVAFSGSGENPEDFFWFVDSVEGTYRTILLTGSSNNDAVRIDALLQAKLGSNRSRLGLILERLSERQLRRQDRLQRRPNPVVLRPVGFTVPQAPLIPEFRLAAFTQPLALELVPARQFYSYCSGEGYASIETLDPALITLTETVAWAEWEWDGTPYYYFETGGSCYANPETNPPSPIDPTHWTNDACTLTITANFFDATTYTQNSSHNYDFGNDNLRTSVYDTAAVWHQNEFAQYLTTHSDWGEFHEFIFGWAGWNSAYC